MGVPGFFLWLWKNYKQSHFVFQKEKLLDINEEVKEIISELNEIDYFLIDTNCLIHPMCFKILAENSEITNIEILEGKMINKVLEYITHLVDYVKPKEGVFIAIDVLNQFMIKNYMIKFVKNIINQFQHFGIIVQLHQEQYLWKNYIIK